VRAGGKQSGDDRPRRLFVGQGSEDLSVPVEAHTVRGIDDDLAVEEMRLLRDDLSQVVEPQRKHDCVDGGGRVLHRCGAGIRPELVGKRLRLRLVLRGNDNGLAACRERTIRALRHAYRLAKRDFPRGGQEK
jgi:hypothetical protein